MKYQEFRRLCLALPEAEERETWGEATFRVRDRIFAMGAAEGKAVSLKASLDDQAGLMAMDPRTFSVSAYTGRYGWVTVRLAGLGPELGERLIQNAWERTAPRRLVDQKTREAGLKTRGYGSDRRRRAVAPRSTGARLRGTP